MKFKEKLKNVLVESLENQDEIARANEALAEEDSPYIKKLSEALEVEAPDLYKFLDFSSKFQYDNVDEINLDKDKMDDSDYTIYLKVFDKFGKPEFDFTDEDLQSIGCSREDYNFFHSI